MRNSRPPSIILIVRRPACVLCIIMDMVVIFQDDIPELIWYAVAEIGALEDHIRSFAHAQYALLWSQEGECYYVICPRVLNSFKTTWKYATITEIIGRTTGMFLVYPNRYRINRIVQQPKSNKQ
jgi:hypothetical protein